MSAQAWPGRPPFGLFEVMLMLAMVAVMLWVAAVAGQL